MREAAVRLLARREHARRELDHKLSQRGFAPEVVREVLDQLEQERLLNEERFVEGYVHARAERGYGPLRIRAELRERGVDQELAERQLTRIEDWSERARGVRQKRFGPTLPVDAREQARQVRFLHYRGFDGEQIRSAFNDEWE